MEENPPDVFKHADKSSFKDILIGPNNDDAIVPIGTTFDKVVLHIGIGSRNGVVIENPKNKDMTTSMRYATRKLFANHNGINKDRGEGDNMYEDYRKLKIDEQLNTGNALQYEIEFASKLLQSYSSKNPVEIQKARRTMSESEVLGQSKNVEDVEDDIGQNKTTVETTSSPDSKATTYTESKDESKTVEEPKVGTVVDIQVIDKANANTDVVVDKLTKTIFEALIAKSSLKEACDVIDKAYDNEVLTDKEEAADCIPNEELPPNKMYSCLTKADDTNQCEDFEAIKRGSERFPEHLSSNTSKKKVSFCDEALQIQTITDDETGTDIEHDDTVLNSHKYEVTEDNISVDSVSISDPSNTIVDNRPIKKVSKNVPPDVTLDNILLDSVSYSDPCDTILDKRSLDAIPYSDSFSSISDQGQVSDGELSDSDTLDGIDDIDTDDDSDILDMEYISLVGENGYDGEEAATVAAEARNDTYGIDDEDGAIDDDDYCIIDGDGTIDDGDAKDDDNAADNVKAENNAYGTNYDVGVKDDDIKAVNDDGVTTYDDNDLFGVIGIYKESGLHCELGKKPMTEYSAEKRDFGYKFFSLSTFYLN